MQEEDKTLILRQLMSYGAIVGMVLIGNALMLNFMGINIILNQDATFLTNLQPLIIGFGVYFSMKHFSAKVVMQPLKFGKYSLYGLLTSLFFGLIYGLYLVVFIKYISPGTLSSLTQMITDQYKQVNVPQEIVNQVIPMVSQPIFLFFMFFTSVVFWGFIFTLMFAFLNLILPKPKNNQPNKNL